MSFLAKIGNTGTLEFEVRSPIAFSKLNWARPGTGTLLQRLLGEGIQLDEPIAKRAQRGHYWYQTTEGSCLFSWIMPFSFAMAYICFSFCKCEITRKDIARVGELLEQKLFEIGLRPQDFMIVDESEDGTLLTQYWLIYLDFP